MDHPRDASAEGSNVGAAISPDTAAASPHIATTSAASTPTAPTAPAAHSTNHARSSASSDGKERALAETISKLKRLYAMSKRCVDDLRKQLTEKDVTIDSLTQRAAASASSAAERCVGDVPRTPRRIARCVAEDGVRWYLMEWDGAGASPPLSDRDRMGWTRDEYPHLMGDVPTEEGRSTGGGGSGGGGDGGAGGVGGGGGNVEEIRALLAASEEQRESAEDEFRRYRVRSEVIRKQQRSEITNTMNASLKFQQRSIAGDSIASELQRAREQIEELSHVKREMELQELSWRKTKASLMEESHRLKSQLLQSSGPNGGGRGGGQQSRSLNERYESLRQEYKDYRKKARQLMDRKDADLKQVEVRARGAATGRGLGGNARSGSQVVGGQAQTAGMLGSAPVSRVGEDGREDDGGSAALPDNATTQVKVIAFEVG